MNAPPSLEDVLARIAAITGATSDSALAKELGVAKQTLSTWKRRGTIPYERAMQFAEEREISLDYILLGKGKGDFSGGEIDPLLLEGIEQELRRFNPALPAALGVHQMALIYNKVIRQLEPGMNWSQLVKEEVAYYRKIRGRQLSQLNHIGEHDELHVYDEEQRLLKKIGTTVEEVYGVPAANPIEGGATKVEQHIAGTNHQIAGRDLVNKGGKGSKKK